MTTKERLPKRNILIQKLLFLLELNQFEPIARTLSVLVSPHGENPPPYNWDDNALLGKVEKAISDSEELNMDDEKFI